MTQCEQFQDLIIDRMQFGTAVPPNTELSAHMVVCAECRAYHQEMHRVAESFHELPEVTPPADLADRIMARIEGQPAAPQKTPKVTPLPAPGKLKKCIPLAAAVLLLAMAIPVGLQYLPSNQGGNGQPMATHPTEQTVATTTETTTEVTPDAGTNDITHNVGATELASTDHTATHQLDDPAQKPLTSNDNASQTTEPVAASTVTSEDQELASAMLTPPENFAASETESDPYYDPLTELVGF